MLANVGGVPLGAFAGQLMGWRGLFWTLAALAAAAIVLITRTVPHDGPAQQTVSVRSEVTALRSGRLWLILAACATTTGGVLAAYSYIAPLLTDRTGLAAGLVPLVLRLYSGWIATGAVIPSRVAVSDQARIRSGVKSDRPRCRPRPDCTRPCAHLGGDISVPADGRAGARPSATALFLAVRTAAEKREVGGPQAV